MGPSKHLKGAYFYRIIDRFIDQTGMETGSIYGGQFKDDAGGLKLQHDRPVRVGRQGWDGESGTVTV